MLWIDGEGRTGLHPPISEKMHPGAREHPSQHKHHLAPFPGPHPPISEKVRHATWSEGHHQGHEQTVQQLHAHELDLAAGWHPPISEKMLPLAFGGGKGPVHSASMAHETMPYSIRAVGQCH